jgi:cobalamin biosynthesis Mg chelatase CobN
MFARKAPVIVLAGLAALLVAGCGGSDGIEGTIPAANADRLKLDLAAVQGSVATNDCDAAMRSAQQFVSDVNNLPDTAGTALKEALRAAGENLIAQTQDPSQCQQGATGATGFSDVQPTTSSSTSSSTSTSSTTSSSSTAETNPPNPGHGGEPPGQGGGNPGGGGGGDTGGTGDSGGTGD